MSRGHFPLLEYYRAQGRLTIVNADVKQFIADRPKERWSFIFMDAYQTDTNLYCPRKLLASLRNHTDSLWLNILDRFGGSRMCSMIRLLRLTGWSLGTALPVSSIEHGTEFQSGNILIGTDMTDPDRLMAFTPFADLYHERAVTARRVYASTIEESASLHSW